MMWDIDQMKPLSATVVLSLFTPSFRRSTFELSLVNRKKMAKPKNHGNLQERKHPSANRPQVLHSETSPFTQHNRKEMQQTKLPHRRHQFMPTEKHRLSAHVQSLWRILHRKHDTIPTGSNKRTLDQRQLVGKKTSYNTPSQQQP